MIVLADTPVRRKIVLKRADNFMKKYILLICVLFLFLIGCGRAESLPEESEPADVPVFAGETWDTGITPAYMPQLGSFLIVEDMLYFVDKGDGDCAKIYRVSLHDLQSPQEAELFLKQESGNIEAMAAGKDEAGADCLAVLGQDGAGARFLALYGLDGGEQWRQRWDEDASAEGRGQAVLRLAQDEKGHYYALGSERIWLLDEKGHWQGEIVCPGKNYLDLCADGRGQVYATCQNDRGETVLYRVDYQKRKLWEETSVSCDGSMWIGGEDTLLMQGDGSVMMYSPGRGDAAELFRILQVHLRQEDVQTMKILPEGGMLVVSWEPLNREAPVTVTRVYETQGELQPKTTITLLLPQALLQADQGAKGGIFGKIVEEFNSSGEEYEVVLEGVELGEGADLYAAVNTRLLAKESADLIYLLDYQDIERYMAKGYLEDLTPYLEESERLSQDDYLEPVLRCYRIGDALYDIPVSFSVYTLAGKASELGEAPGWTVDEFLGWLENHPDVLAKEGLSRSHILTYCLMGGMDAYLDRESRQGRFEGEDFQSLLQRIRKIERDDAGHWDDWSELVKGGEKPVLDLMNISDFLYCGEMEYQYGEALVYKGFPTEDGAPCYFYDDSAIAILSRSANKEGAYAFWEYYLTHRVMTLSESSYFTNRDALEKSMEYASDQYRADRDSGEGHLSAAKSEGLEEGVDWYPAMTQQQRDKQLAMMEHVRPDTLENMTIRNMILEEAQYYFEGDKSLEETCGVIQSRVQLYLDETGR